MTDVLGLPDPDDVRLRDGLIAGAEPALAELYDTYGPVVFGMALHVTRDRGAAEDITQDVFVDLWRRPEHFDPHRSPLRSWLLLIARRRGIDWIRRRDARESVRLATMDPAPTLLEDDVLASTARKQVRKAIADLPAPHRQAILLAYYRGLTYREVAKELDIPEGTAKWRLRNALRRIGAQLRAEGFEDRLNFE
ncbi:sigma-70 family RNA polymerase sigma factor [Asanoa siamensis]|uniref:RNA polymerase sigma factor SigK n=1 Tax=Asanoa siamensis TaxID=926357 RepID=A0ABQ4CQ26_9ACTN|nr:sigma-70 family RNA polymerase sigma factor [Asanoa siamensis]GIF73391.1 RNA polymerase sigma factor SigK [Asanoa siamensis]